MRVTSSFTQTLNTGATENPWPQSFSSKKSGNKPRDILNAFTATQRNFGESFDNSTHAAVIKLMMMTFGQSPHDMFREVKASGNGYEVTMKDEYKVQVSHAELKQVAQASRFGGSDSSAIKDANFALAAYVKRKQQIQGLGSFESALAATLKGDTVKRCLEGMGVIGAARYVSSSNMTGKGAMGVMGTHTFGGALVMEGIKHEYNQRQPVNNSYGYMLFNDESVVEPPSTVDKGNLKLSSKPVGVKPDNLFSGFYQGVQGNCVTVSAIKAAMMRFGQNPEGIYRQVSKTASGYEVVMRDSFKLTVTDEELKKAKAGSHFFGSDPGLLADANFMYAVSAKRAQIENNDFRANRSFELAMETLNDGEYPGEAFDRLGLFAYVRNSSAKELASGAIGTVANGEHSMAVIDGALDRYGVKERLLPSNWSNGYTTALKLV
ncbi:hypothetical protein [Pseudomonas sp. 16FHM2]